ncbi:hypothetical protein SISSUDRAFT_1128831 [Sistotremastrum suecicum HHB10207 ss-3]|uniref:Uncharacterized protein n=1 Tax=Sistotremastrum suecicum HHB10207 ss-3 TaxID=1314776 RepID=A0A166DCV5_9AGAM|nr:hypothetical protein SISSUDRAFT_1128831 [Sistotremastrum suecicum HHB10207 ss-3]
MDNHQQGRKPSQISDAEKIIHLSDVKLEALKFLGPDAVQEVIDLIEVVKNNPEQFKWLTVFQLQCLDAHKRFHPSTSALPTSHPSSGATLLSNTCETTAVEPDLVSPFERVHFYTGVSEDHPLLFHRSDLLQHPFVIPRDRFSVIPEKTAHSANHAILKHTFWKETVAPEIIELLKDPSRGICVSTMLPVRFSTPDEDGRAVLDDYIVLWISVHPNTTKETSCRNANVDILSLLAKHGIQDAVVHWIEGAVEPLAGPPPLMRVVGDTDPSHYIRRALTAVSGMPLAADALAESGVQGSLGLYIHEGKDRRGNKSERLMCITNKHVISSNTGKDYDYSDRPGAPQKFIRNCGSSRFQQVINETRALIATKLGDVTLFSKQLSKMSAKLASEDDEEMAADEEDKERKQQDLKRVERDIVKLSHFLLLLTSTWSDAYQRIIGYVDWAPRIVSDLDNRRYTRDLGVIALDETKFKENYQGNAVYLAGKYTREDITSFFSPNVTSPSSFKYPDDHLFRLSGYVDATGLANPYLLDENGKAGFIVAKAGQSTDLTFGRVSEFEAYTCDKSGRHSWEVAVFNFSKKHGDFSCKGDSGAAIFNAEGKLVAQLHSGMPRGISNHVTFGTPGHYVVNLIKEHYPHADFDS